MVQGNYPSMLSLKASRMGFDLQLLQDEITLCAETTTSTLF